MPFLLSLFRDFSQTRTLSAWAAQAALFLQGKPLDKAFFVKELRSFSFSPHPVKQQEILESLFLTLSFFEEKIFAVQSFFFPFYEKITEEAVSKEISSIFYLEKLCGKFFEKKRDFSPCKEKQSWELFSFFHPHFSIKGILYKSLWAFFCGKGYEVIEEEIRVYEGLLDYYERPFTSLWSYEENYDIFSVYLSYYLLFFCVGTLFKKEKFLQRIEPWKAFLQGAKEYFSKKEWILALLIETWVVKQGVSSPSFLEKATFSSSVFFPQKGFLGRRFAHVSYLFTLGANTSSLGAFQGKEIKIASFGFQKDLNDFSRGLGFLKRVSLLEEDFAVQSHTNSLSLSGWTALQESNRWLKMQLQALREKVDFTFFFLEKEPLYLLFYVEADRALLGNSSIYPNSLQKQKETVEKVTFEKKEEKWSLICKQRSQVEVIPLCGEKNFWGSSFLVACPLLSQKDNLFSMEFL